MIQCDECFCLVRAVFAFLKVVVFMDMLQGGEVIKSFGTWGMRPYFCTPFKEWFGLSWFESGSGQNHEKDGLPDSIMVVRQILVLFVLVRIQVGQQNRTSKEVHGK